jgi:hypothetical protein
LLNYLCYLPIARLKSAVLLDITAVMAADMVLSAHHTEAGKILFQRVIYSKINLCMGSLHTGDASHLAMLFRLLFVSTFQADK